MKTVYQVWVTIKCLSAGVKTDKLYAEATSLELAMAIKEHYSKCSDYPVRIVVENVFDNLVEYKKEFMCDVHFPNLL